MGYQIKLFGIELNYFTVLRLNSCQRPNEVTMRNNCCGMDTFAHDIFGERVCSLHQNIFRLNCNPSVIFFSVMPPTFIQMIKTQMGKHFCKFIRRTSYIAAVDQLLSYCCVNLKRQSIFKNQLSCLQCPSEG